MVAEPSSGRHPAPPSICRHPQGIGTTVAERSPTASLPSRSIKSRISMCCAVPGDSADLFAAYLMLHLGKEQARRWVEGVAYSAHRSSRRPSRGTTTILTSTGFRGSAFYNPPAPGVAPPSGGGAHYIQIESACSETEARS
jgi:hypothetical protein